MLKLRWASNLLFLARRAFDTLLGLLATTWKYSTRLGLLNLCVGHCCLDCASSGAPDVSLSCCYAQGTRRPMNGTASTLQSLKSTAPNPQTAPWHCGLRSHACEHQGRTANRQETAPAEAHLSQVHPKIRRCQNLHYNDYRVTTEVSRSKCKGFPASQRTRY